MSRKIGRGALAALAAGAMALTLGSTASADVIDTDNPVIGVPEATVGSAKLFRIADANRVLTAVKASKSSNAWGSITTSTTNVWDCQGNYPQNPFDGATTTQSTGTRIEVPVLVGFFPPTVISVECVSVVDTVTTSGTMDIIISRDDDYPDALAAAPLADVRNAPILLHPTNLVDNDPRPTHTDEGLVPQVEAEIARLAGLAGPEGNVTGHVLGGTGALSHDVENAIDAIPGVDRTVRYQGMNRFETATTIANVTVGFYRIESGAAVPDVNAYLTTGLDFPDALSAGAAAANNDGVVLLTNGEGWDRDDITREYLKALRSFVDDNWMKNTTEVFAVGGPSTRAAEGPDGVSLAASYWGADRYETATKTAAATFADPDHFAIVSGYTFADALVGSGFIANADGPLLLTQNDKLNNHTANYLKADSRPFGSGPNVDNGDTIVVFGGGGSVTPQVSADVKALLDGLFALPSW